MNVPEKKNQAIVVGTILCLNWYSYLFGIYRDKRVSCISLRYFIRRTKILQLNYPSFIKVCIFVISINFN